MGLFGSGTPSIDVKEAQRRAAAGEVLLVDVREQDEWRSGHAPAATHVPLATVPAKLASLSQKGLPIAFICRSGGRSGQACGAAKNAGVEALNVKGGMNAWRSAGLPVAQ